ncbi:fas apoptotic inhibitory molecule 3 isoform c precursor, partial [Daubentonia madagascariensis]
SGALKILPEVHMEGELGGSVIIECPLPKTQVRIYLCRETSRSGICATVVSSNSFIKKEYTGRVTLRPCPDKNLFLVEVTELTKNDSGAYACGVGKNTDKGKTQKVTLNVHSEYEPFWEEEPMPEPPKWFHKFLHLQVPPWFQMPTRASSSKFISKVTTQAQRTEAPPVHHPSPTTLIIHHPRVSRASSIAAAKPPTLPPSTSASKTSAQERLLRPRTAGYNHHTRLHRQSPVQASAPTGPEDARPAGLAAAPGAAARHIAAAARPKQRLQRLPAARSAGGRRGRGGGPCPGPRNLGAPRPAAGV